MTPLYGNADAHAAFRAAMSAGALHHAWLLAGPEGIGKATFAHRAAARLLAEAAGEPGLTGDFGIDPAGRTASLIAAGAHPDFRLLTRLPRDEKKPDELARSIPIAQIRTLGPMFATVPSLSFRRVVVIDSVDYIERPAASNALLKNLEEPPAGTVFLLVSHAPGRLLPTIRSRCRTLRFAPLDDAAMRDALTAMRSDTDADEIAALVRAGDGSPGRALRYAGLDLRAIDVSLAAIARDGDPANRHRIALAKGLSGKAAQARYEAFLDRVPGFIAEQSRLRHGADLRVAIDAYTAAREVAGAARGLSLDPSGTVFEIGGIIARLAAR